MNLLKEFFKSFRTITVAILIVCAVNLSLSGDLYTVSSNILWEIVLSGAVTSFITTVLLCREYKTKAGTVISLFVHYVLISAVMLVFGSKFEWIDVDIGGVACMMISVGVVYAFTVGAVFLIDKKEADDLNKSLEKRYKK